MSLLGTPTPDTIRTHIPLGGYNPFNTAWFYATNKADRWDWQAICNRGRKESVG